MPGTIGSFSVGSGTIGGTYPLTSSPPTVAVEIDFTTDLSAGIAYAEQVVLSAPYAAHPLQETSGVTPAADLSGNEHTGAYAGTITSYDQTSGKPVTGDPASRYIVLGADGRVTFTGQVPPRDQITIEGWIYRATLDGSSATEYQMMSNGGTFAEASILAAGVRGDGKLYAYFGNAFVVSAAPVVSAATWYHVAFTLDGANQSVAMYVNGAPVTVASGFGADVALTGVVSLAAMLTSWRWGGGIVGVTVSRLAIPAVYLRQLSASEIGDHYAAAATAPFAGYTWTDVTPYVLFSEGLTRRFGRETQLDDITPMTLTYTLRNDDRRFEVGYAGDVANYLRNPSFETGTGGWTAVNGTLLQDGATAWVGSYSGKFTVSAGGAFIVQSVYGVEGDVYQGARWAAVANVHAHSGTEVGKTVTLQLNETGGMTGDEVVASGMVTLSSVYQPVTLTGTIGRTDRTGIYLLAIPNGFAAGNAMKIDAELVCRGATATYVDPTTNAAYEWEGDVGASRTLLKQPYENLEPGRPTRVTMTKDGITYDWAFGFIQDWPQVWDRSVRFGRVPIVATCFLERLNQENIGTRDFSEQLAGARETVILNAAGVPLSMRDMDPGASALMGGTFENVTAGDHARQAARSDSGFLFFDGRGYAVYQDGAHRATAARSLTPRGVLGGGVGNELPYWSPEFHAPSSMIRNEISLRRPGGVEQTVIDAPSRIKNGKRSYNDEVLLVDDTAIAAKAQALLDSSKDMRLRVKEVTFNPAAVVGLWGHALGVQFSDRYTWRLRPYGSGATNRDVYVEGVQDEWRNGEYLSTWFLSLV